MRVVVFGASGGVGSRAVAALSAGGHEVVGVVRRTEALAAVEDAGAEAVLADVVADDLGPALAGADAVLWALGARFATDGPDGADRIDRAGSGRAVDAAAAAGVRRWVQVSSLLADRPELGPPMLAAFLHAKGASDAALLASPLDATVLRPSGLSDEPGVGAVRAAEHLDPGDWGGGRPPQVSRDDVAALAVLCVTEALGAGRAYDVIGGSTPLPEALG